MSTNLGSQFVHVVGVWFGHGKPVASQLLPSFIDDLRNYLRDGYMVSTEKHVNLKLKYITADIPAMAILKGGKGGTAYASCIKCTVYGEHEQGRRCFIVDNHNKKYNDHKNLPKRLRKFVSKGKHKGREIIPEHTPMEPVTDRTDQSFRARAQPSHHAEGSLFEDLDIDMVESFTIDGMHTAFIGILKRFLHFLLGEGSTRVRRYISKRNGRPLAWHMVQPNSPVNFLALPATSMDNGKRPNSECSSFTVEMFLWIRFYPGLL